MLATAYAFHGDLLQRDYMVLAPGYLPGIDVEFPSGLTALVQIPISFFESSFFFSFMLVI